MLFAHPSTRLCAFTLLLASAVNGIADQPTATIDESDIDDDAIMAAFSASHDGYSSDELMIRDDLRVHFFAELAESNSLNSHQQRDAILRLLRLRKAGKLKVVTTRRGKSVEEVWRTVAEIAARAVLDRNRVTTDQMLADPKLLSELHDEAVKLVDEVDDYAIRKSILALRKIRRLRPELVLRVAEWQREIRTIRVDSIAPADIPAQPGVYLFRSLERYLYIGESSDLSKRLKEHVGGSHNAALARLLSSDAASDVTIELHIFGKNSPATKASVRQAYESELIRSRHPKYNLRP